MKNVFDIKKEKCLDFILPRNKNLSKKSQNHVYQKIIIVIHLHYYEKVSRYLEYVNNIPNEIQLLFTVSSLRMKEKLEAYLSKTSKHYKIVMKANRGRDISALLVAAKIDILQYEIVCFLHDKREKTEYFKESVEQWEYCLWENSVGTKAYIDNIIFLFENNAKIGMLSPPAPTTEHFSFGYSNTWSVNFELANKLASKLQLKCNLDREKPPIALGTVFWARVNAIEKILIEDWKYEDFDEEPLSNDGTLSHAIERIFPYIVQDAGYETGWVMTDRYAAEQIEYDIDVLGMVLEVLKIYGIYDISEVREFIFFLQSIRTFGHKFEQLCIYGAGKVGKVCFNILNIFGISPDVFLVTNKQEDEESLFGVPIQSVDNFSFNKKTGILVAVSDVYRECIQKELALRNISEKQIFFIDANFLKKRHLI